MPDIGLIDPSVLLDDPPPARSKTGQRAVFLGVAIAAAIAGAVVTPAADAASAVAQAGPELTHLLRAMAGMKALAAVGLAAATFWRLATPASSARLIGYTLAAAAMAAGPGLIWQMAHLKLGALLLHSGLLACILLLWRDPGTTIRLEAIILRRRQALQQKSICP